jgi:hypothetical protein
VDLANYKISFLEDRNKAIDKFNAQTKTAFGFGQIGNADKV